ncbi:MAG: hypothetical protein ABR557_06180 [Pyrinomonadaceae bacterium]
MSKIILIGNIDFGTSGEHIRELFEQVGTVQRVGFIRKSLLSQHFPEADVNNLMINNEVIGTLGRILSRMKTPARFGVVEMASEQEAQNAVQRLQGTELPGSDRIILLSGPHGPGKGW